uniref:hypothetical protein n=1 Tax=Aquitalea magnusonii TaxID=332411 RepID=UPI00195EA6BE
FVSGRFPGHIHWLPQRLLDFFLPHLQNNPGQADWTFRSMAGMSALSAAAFPVIFTGCHSACSTSSCPICKTTPARQTRPPALSSHPAHQPCSGSQGRCGMIAKAGTVLHDVRFG